MDVSKNRTRVSSANPPRIERYLPGAGEFFEKFGHRNWIVIADSAYPLHASPAVLTCISRMGMLQTLGLVFEIVRSRANVRPIVYLDSELAFVSERHAPGIGAFNGMLQAIVAPYAPTRLLHGELVRKLDDAADLFRVLVIKTSSTFPYTSVFVEAGCRYWTDEAEAGLREAMANSKEAAE